MFTVAPMLDPFRLACGLLYTSAPEMSSGGSTSKLNSRPRPSVASTRPFKVTVLNCGPRPRTVTPLPTPLTRSIVTPGSLCKVTIDRVRGVGNGVTVRGLGPQFNTVTLNGRVLATDGRGREFNFDVLPPELISGADVYKSPQANLNGSSIGATVNIHSLRPLEQKVGLQAGGSMHANIDELGGNTTPSGALYTTWKSDSGRLGA